MSGSQNKKLTKKDIIILCVFATLAIIHIVYELSHNELTSVNSLIEDVILLLLSFVGLIEIFQYVKWDIVVPDFILSKNKQKEEEELSRYTQKAVEHLGDAIINKSLDMYFNKEVNFLKDYSDEKVEFIMSQLGINSYQLESICLELVKMRCLPLKDLEDAKDKVFQFIKCGKPMVIDLKSIDPAKRTYKDVNYYLNFNDAMYIDDSCREFAQIMNLLICEKIGLDKFDRLVIPYDSNIILGVEVGKLLGKPVVKMRYDKGRVEVNSKWDGIFKPKEKLLIIHDVLVSGAQITHTINNIPTSCTIIGLCCIVSREEGTGKKILQENNIPLQQVVILSDNDIKKILSE